MLTVTGSTNPLLEGVGVKDSGAAQFDISGDGRLVYVLGGAGTGAQRSLVWVDRDGGEEPIPAQPHFYALPRLSPDGRRLAVDTRGEDDDIWIWDFAGETLTRLILGDGANQYPAWTPNGERVAYTDGSGDLYWMASNNTGAPELLAAAPGSVDPPSPYFFTPDGTALVLRDRNNPETNDDLVMISIEDDAPAIWRLNGDFRERNAELSPDGRWMAYQSDASGQFEIYVRPFPEVEEDQVQVSNNGGFSPLWSRDGGELFYLQPGVTTQLMSVSYDTAETDAAFAFRDREVVLEWPYITQSAGRTYDVSLDGRRFLAVEAAEGGGGEGSTPEITVVLNWFEELRERMGN